MGVVGGEGRWCLDAEWGVGLPDLGVGMLAGLLAGFAPPSAQAMSASAYVTDINGHAVFQFGLGPGGLLSALAPATVEAGTRRSG